MAVSKPYNVDTLLYDGMVVWQSVLSIDESCIGLQLSRSLCVLAQDFRTLAYLKLIELCDKGRNLRFHVGEEA
jgi:hypothetical protein